MKKSTIMIKQMKIPATFFILFLTAYVLSGQNLNMVDGLYRTEDDKLYSGKYKEFYPSGKVRIILNIALGQLDGITTLFFEDGSTNEVRCYKMSQMDGTWITWNEQGAKIAEANYFEGKKHGKWYVWDENGTLRYDMTYDKGKKHGIWIIYSKEEKEIARKVF